MLYNVVLKNQYVCVCVCVQSQSMTIQMKSLQQSFPIVMFVMLYKVVLTFECVNEILPFDHSNESSPAVFPFGAVYFSSFSKMILLNFQIRCNRQIEFAILINHQYVRLYAKFDVVVSLGVKLVEAA